MDAVVRLASHGDAGALARLRWLSRGSHEQARQTCSAFEDFSTAWFEEAIRSPDWHIAVAGRAQRGLIGCMYVRKVGKVPVPGGGAKAWGYLTSAFVVEQERSAGIGSALLQLLIERARDERLEFLQVWPSTASVAFYQRAGFLSPDAQRVRMPDDEPSYFLPIAD